jgi:Cu+-exporting ATPase
MLTTQSSTLNFQISEVPCAHCGDTCADDSLHLEDKVFCCEGCKTVYQILAEKDLCTYYDLSDSPAGIKLKNRNFGEKFAALDNPDIAQKIVEYADSERIKLTLYLPAMHCASCIWLLENLYKLREGIGYSRVNFMRKEITLQFNPQQISLREVAELLTTLGYEPQINLDTVTPKLADKQYKRLLYQLGVTGFCLGNIMLLAFPDYLAVTGVDFYAQEANRSFFIGLNLVLALPVFFYGALDYWVSAYKALRAHTMNLDVPISLGIVSLFLRSLYEMLFLNGVGYMDSLASLVFFLLVGKWFQQKIYAGLSFERDYKSYFPLAVLSLQPQRGENISLGEINAVNTPSDLGAFFKQVTDLKQGDIIFIRNQELIPTDGILRSDKALIDYSFVTGEAVPVQKWVGEYVYAGGRQVGEAIEIEVMKEVSQSYLTQLWNNDAFHNDKPSSKTEANKEVGLKTSPLEKKIQQFSYGFLYVTFAIAFLAGLYWFWADSSKVAHVFTAVLVVACPCALSLAMPFALGNALRLLGREGFYLRNADVLLHLAEIDTLVFDKTGTIMENTPQSMEWVGETLTTQERASIATLCRSSMHPLSKQIFEWLNASSSESESTALSNFQEVPHRGLTGWINGIKVQVGSSKLAIKPLPEEALQDEAGKVFVFWQNKFRGYFRMNSHFRDGFPQLVQDVQKDYEIAVVSGDNEAQRENLENILGKNTDLRFMQQPEDKLTHIQGLQKVGKHVLMMGDGLNDAGALKQARVGIALTEDTTQFSPACAGILHANSFPRLGKYLAYSKNLVHVVYWSFLFSLFYNFIGLAWAVTGNLSPLFAAILMPISSASVVAFAVFLSNLTYPKVRK